jgi:predicted RNase H-like HicB family nuclease
MAKTKKVHSYLIDLVPVNEGGYTVVVPALPGCISYGETAEDATRNAREAIELHLENLTAHREPIPKSHDAAPVLSALVQVGPGDVR